MGIPKGFCLCASAWWGWWRKILQKVGVSPISLPPSPSPSGLILSLQQTTSGFYQFASCSSWTPVIGVQLRTTPGEHMAVFLLAGPVSMKNRRYRANWLFHDMFSLKKVMNLKLIQIFFSGRGAAMFLLTFLFQGKRQVWLPLKF